MLSSCGREGLFNNMPFWISRTKQITLGKTNTQHSCIRDIFLNCPYRTEGGVGVPTEAKQVRSAIPERIPPNVTKKKSTILGKRAISAVFLPKISSAVAGVEQSLEKGLIASGNKLFGGREIGQRKPFLKVVGDEQKFIGK